MPEVTRFSRAVALSAGLALGLGLGAARADEKEAAVFDVTLKGIHAGTLSFSGAIAGNSYAAAGVLKTGGLVSLLRKVRYDARSAGRVSAGKFTPSRYEEDADTGKRKSQSVMEYVGGVPQVKVYNPPRRAAGGDIDPGSQGGTVDPLTALFATLRDVPAAEACNKKVTMFDGKRRSQLRLGEAKPSGAGLVCEGEYRRLQGFSEKEMAEKQRFPFTMTLAPIDGGRMRVVEVSMDTLYGKGRLERR